MKLTVTHLSSEMNISASSGSRQTAKKSLREKKEVTLGDYILPRKNVKAKDTTAQKVFICSILDPLFITV